MYNWHDLEWLSNFFKTVKLKFWDWNKFCESTLVLKSFLMLLKRFAICNKIALSGPQIPGRKGCRARASASICLLLFNFLLLLQNLLTSLMCTRMNFTTALSPIIKIFHRHLCPNLYIFTDILRRFYDISPRKNTDQADFVLKVAVHTVGTFLYFTDKRSDSYSHTGVC